MEDNEDLRELIGIWLESSGARVQHASNGLEALRWVRPGDLLVLLIHTRRAEVLEILRAAAPVSR